MIESSKLINFSGTATNVKVKKIRPKTKQTKTEPSTTKKKKKKTNNRKARFDTSSSRNLQRTIDKRQYVDEHELDGARYAVTVDFAKIVRTHGKQLKY